MGRTIKYIRLAAVILLAAVAMCNMLNEKLHAKEAVTEELPENREEPVEQGESEDPEDPEKPEIPVETYRIEVSEPDGKNGYYRQPPEVKIYHLAEERITKYIITSAEGIKTEGVLEEKDSETVIDKELFKEGRNQLEVWGEVDGKQMEETKIYREFLVDRQPPLIALFLPRGFDTWYQRETLLSVSTKESEQGSQIEQIVCYQGERIIGSSQQEQASFVIKIPSTGGKGAAITIVATDKAGNKAQEMRTIYIDQTPPDVGIQGIQDYMITSKPLEVQFWAKEENAIQTLSTEIKWENAEHRLVQLPSSEWMRNGEAQLSRQNLTEDGIYKLSVYAADKAGYSQEKSAQIIIDKHNPVIRYVDELHNKFMREFQWEYPMEEAILDFTSYVYEIRLDGRLYQMGERVLKEGSHLFRVKAIDAAGNEAIAQANFKIDRTPPQIVFIDAEDQQTYEEEKTFHIKLENLEDMIEEISINGKEQRVNPRIKIYSFTMNEHKEHMIYVKASDKAGNQKETQIAFRIEPKRTILQKVLEPVKKVTGINKKEDKAAQKPVNKTQKHNTIFIGILIIAAVGAGLIGVYKIKK